jgi:hypothetical protein
MTPDSSLWRLSVRYKHIDDLTASDLAWEWLRRNDDYDHDVAALGRVDVDPKELNQKIRDQWGLRFPGRPSEGST